jgi:hypothetical protein
MNIRTFAVFGALSAIALGACVVTGTGSSSTDGVGGSVGGGSGIGGGGVGGGAGGGGVGGGGTVTCDDMLGCGEVITGEGDPADLCDASGMLYDAYAACVCDGACSTDCGTSFLCTMGGAEPDATCTMCVQDSCKAVADSCNNDI